MTLFEYYAVARFLSSHWKTFDEAGAFKENSSQQVCSYFESLNSKVFNNLGVVKTSFNISEKKVEIYQYQRKAEEHESLSTFKILAYKNIDLFFKDFESFLGSRGSRFFNYPLDVLYETCPEISLEQVINFYNAVNLISPCSFPQLQFTSGHYRVILDVPSVMSFFFEENRFYVTRRNTAGIEFQFKGFDASRALQYLNENRK